MPENPITMASSTATSAAPKDWATGGWVGIEAIAAKAKMWKSDPPGRNCSRPAATAQTPETTVVNATIIQAPRAGSTWSTR